MIRDLARKNAVLHKLCDVGLSLAEAAADRGRELEAQLAERGT